MTNKNKSQRYYWIKIKESFMTSDKVDFLMSKPEGANYIVLYQMLCLKAINTNGELARNIGEILIPFDEVKIQRDCKYFSIDTIRVALTLFKQLGMIYEQANGIIKIADFDNMIGSETQSAIEKRNQRSIAKEGDRQCPEIVRENVYQDIRDKILDIRDEDIRDNNVILPSLESISIKDNEPLEINNNLDRINPFRNYIHRELSLREYIPREFTDMKSLEEVLDEVVMLYTDICSSYGKVVKLTEDRISKIKTLIKTEKYKVVDFFNVFWNMEKSQFLKGKTDKKKITTDIDWVLVPDNFMKVLEGKYNGENDDIPYTQSPLKLSDGTYFNGRRYRCTEGMVW